MTRKNTDDTVQSNLSGNVETTLVNQEHTDRYTVNIGRVNGQNMNTQEPGEPGWLGNPYPKSKHGREECIELFREDFEERLESDPDFREAVENLRGETLACWCSPKPCHGEVILQYIRTGSTEPESSK